MQLAVVLAAVFTIGLALGTILGFAIKTLLDDLDRLEHDEGATIVPFPNRDGAA